MDEYVSPSVSASLFDVQICDLPNLLNESGEINWNIITDIINPKTVKKILEFSMDDENNDFSLISENFKEFSPIIFKLASESKSYLFTQKQNNAITTKLFKLYSIQTEQILISLKNNDKIKQYSFFCCILSLIERILIDITILNSPDSNPPKVLKDLLKFSPTTDQLHPIQVKISFYKFIIKFINIFS